MFDPGLPERNGNLDTFHALANLLDLPSRRAQSDALHVSVRVDLLLVREAAHQCAHGVLQARAARDDDPQRNCTICVQPFEILQVAVEERILVVPLDFQRDGSALKCPNVIDLMGLGFAFDPVDDPLNDELLLPPATLLERIPDFACLSLPRLPSR